ncbi:MAG: hypothetical protein JWO58_1578 [Chitinophagaceae bacterium]|nr:hypothetical protein [Chitinophagaceae bacterium]
MKKTLPQIQYSRLFALYQKLQARLNRNFASGRFQEFTKRQQQRLLHRIEKLKAQLHSFERGLQLAGTALALTAALHVNGAQAQSVANGSEFQVNTYTSNDQVGPTVAQDANGNFVVTWSSDGQDGSNSGIYAQRYNAAGVAQGTEFRVNTYTTNKQDLPVIGMDASGNFVIAWESNGQDGDGYGIYAQRYNAAGVAQGGEFRINSTTTDEQSLPAIAMDDSGDFVIAWNYGTVSGFYTDYDVYAQRYNAAGMAQGGEFLATTTTSGNQQNPSVGLDNSGNFVITWESDYSDDEIYAQQFTAAGVGQGEFKVNTSTESYQVAPTIGVDGNGDFVITWEISGRDGSDEGIFAQRFNSSAVKQGAEFQVNSYTSDNQFQPYIAVNKSSHDFVITWISSSQDGSSYGVYAQSYSAAGVAKGSEFQVNTTTTSIQISPTISMDANGDLLIVWQSYGQDSPSYGIYAQRYTNAITTATQSQAATSLFNLYPNPAKGQALLAFDGNDEVQVNIMTLSGVLVKESSITDKTISLEGLKAGVYMVEITKGGQKEMKRLVVE